MNVLLFAHLLGLLTALGFPPFGIWPLTWIAGAGMVWLLLSHARLEDRKTAGWIFAHYSFSVNLYGFYWIAYTLREFAGMPWIAAALILLAVFAIIGALAFFFGWMWPWIALKTERGIFAKVPPVLYLALWLVVWNAADLRAFPWVHAQSV
ncbi:MAG: hypothetical protein ABIO95_09500, partial [Bdellovibrionota bacterium]